MGELSGDSESSERRTAADGGAAGPDQQDQQDRPKLVALPGPAAALAPVADDALPAPDDAEPTSGGAAAESDPASVAAAAAVSADADRLALERSLSGPPDPRSLIVGAPSPAAARTTDLAVHTPASPYAPWAPQPQLPGIAIAATPELVQALRAELAMRSHAEAGLRARAVDAETRLATRLLLSQRTAGALHQVRAEFDQLAGLLADERARRQAAEQRVAELEQQLAADRGRPDDAAPTAATELRADRLSDALTRLRADTEPIDPAPAGPVAPAALTAVTAVGTPTAPPATLAGPFRTLCRRDPALAGQLALSLLPMQRVVYPQPVSYDILLGPGHGCVQVTAHDGRTAVARQASARSLQDVDFHVVGNPERFAKLLAAGRIRRRLGFGVARVRGNRDGLAALDALLALPLDLPALVEGGMSTDPSILLSLVAAIVRPDWTRDARFAISHRGGNATATYLLIADGRKPTVTMVAPTGPIATVISCAQSDLASVLSGSPALEPHSLRVAGDPAPLAQLQAWIKRAQSE